MQYTEILDQIGGWGRYQKIVCLLLAVSAIPNGYFTMTPVFTNKTPDHRCLIPEIDYPAGNDSFNADYDAEGLEMYIPWDDSRHRYSRCKRFNMSSSTSNSSLLGCDHGYVYGGRPGEVTAVTEWDLVCDQSHVKPLITSIYMAGVLFGSLLSGAVADKFGRWPVIIGATYLQFLFMGLNIFNVSPGMFAAMMFLSGATSLINFVAAVVLATELVDTERRAFVETTIMLGFSFGYVLLPFFAYFILLWKWLLLIGGLSGVLYIPYWWLIPESPRWLITVGKFDEARNVLREIARKNKKTLDIESLFPDACFKLIAEQKEERKVSARRRCFSKFQIPYLDLFIQPGMLTKTLCSCYSWFVISLSYYTLSLNTGSLGGNDFVNCFISAAVEIPAYSSVYLVLRNKGRRFIMVLYMAIAALCCMATPLINKVSVTGAVVCSMIGKFFVTCLFSLVYLFTAELFPTEGRNQALGITSTCARLGSVLVPYIIFLGEVGSQDVPYFIIGSIAIMACLTNLLLPETQGNPLPDTYEEAHTLQRTPFLCFGQKKSLHRKLKSADKTLLQ